MPRPFIVLIGGSYSGCGKTTFGTGLIRSLGKGWAVIKYTKTGFYSSIITNREILLRDGKDTRLYLDAGAEEVLWLQSPEDNLDELLSQGLERLSLHESLKGIIVEGNSPIEFLMPDVVVFVNGHERPKKPSSIRVLERAHIIVEPSEFGKAMEETKELIEKKFLARQELLRQAPQNRIPCGLARRIAETYGIKYKEIGEMADALGIKITNCELGCF